MEGDLLYINELDSLFDAVQAGKIFKDQKTFTDAAPRKPVDKIIEAYNIRKTEPGFDLKKFIKEHFELPVRRDSSFHTNEQHSIKEHIDQLWDVLTKQPGKNRGTLIGLPKRFVVPGGRFREIYYWDSYFTMLGLQASGRIALVQDMVDNFAWLIGKFGHIPNGNRTYFLSRSQPPFFSHMVQLLMDEKGLDLLVKYLPELELEYQFWMDGSQELTTPGTAIKHCVLMPSGQVLNRYWDEENTPRPEGYEIDLQIAQTSGNPDLFRNIRAACESGWDFTSRWFRETGAIATIQTTSIVPIDLNCLIYHLEQLIGRAYMMTGNEEKGSGYKQKAIGRRKAILGYLWNNRKNMFMDYNFVTNSSTEAVTMAMAFPLFIGIATTRQAGKTLDHIEQLLLKPGGLLATSYNTSEQWDAPNGWAPLQWVGYEAARKYANLPLANAIKNNWTQNVERVFLKTRKIMEKYNVVDTSLEAGGGEYDNQDGFGWTNGVYMKLTS